MKDDKFHWVEVPEGKIDPVRRDLANSVADYCKDGLGYRRPQVRWFAQTTEPDLRILIAMQNISNLAKVHDSRLPYFGSSDGMPLGFYSPRKDLVDCIFLRDNLSRSEIKSTFAHELCHFLGGEKRFKDWTEDEREGVATRFEERVLFEINRRFL